MATNPYSYGSLGQRWTVGEPTSKSLLDVSRVKADANRWALEQLLVDPDDTANFVLTAPGLNIDSNTLYVDSVYNSVGFGLTNPNDYAFNGTPSWVASGGAGNASVIIVSGTTSIGYLSFADGTTGTDRYSGNIQYNHGTNTMSFRTNGGVEAMTINSAQDLAVDTDTLFVDASADRVGINSNSPSTPLHVKDASTAYVMAETTGTGTSAGFRLKGDASADYTIFTTQGVGDFGIYDNANTAQRLTIDTSGNVGIGTTSPQRPLHIDGTEGVARFTSTASGNNGLEVGIGTSSQAFIWQAENSYLQFATNNVERARITSDGKVGINDTSPDFALDCNVASGDLSSIAACFSTNAAQASISFQGTGTTDNASARFGIKDNDNFFMYQNDANTFFFGEDGKFGINTMSPSYTLVVEPASVLGDGNFLAEFNATSNGLIIARYNCGSDNDRSGLYFENQGVVNSRVWVDDSMNLRIQNSNPTANNSGTVVGTQTSDARLKEVFGPVASSLDEVLKLNPVRYALKNENRERLGFIAQEVKEVLPQTVYDTMVTHEDDEETLLAMEYVGIIPVLVNAIKELNNRIAALEAA